MPLCGIRLRAAAIPARAAIRSRFFVTMQPWRTLQIPQIIEFSLIHNAEFIMLNDLAKPNVSSKFSEYMTFHYAFIIMHYALTNGMSFRKKNKHRG